MRIHYIITTIIYIILSLTIVLQKRYYNERVYFISQGSYFIGCVHGMNEIFQTISQSVTTECAKMTEGLDNDKIIKMIDAISKVKN